MQAKGPKILVVDDDADLRWMVEKYLSKHEFNVTLAEDGVKFDLPHHWDDQVSLRLGGDINVVPETLALRAGVHYETSAGRPVVCSRGRVVSVNVFLAEHKVSGDGGWVRDDAHVTWERLIAACCYWISKQ